MTNKRGSFYPAIPKRVLVTYHYQKLQTRLSSLFNKLTVHVIICHYGVVKVHLHSIDIKKLRSLAIQRCAVIYRALAV